MQSIDSDCPRSMGVGAMCVDHDCDRLVRPTLEFGLRENRKSWMRLTSLGKKKYLDFLLLYGVPSSLIARLSVLVRWDSSLNQIN